jgi:hypothetical protein
VVSPTTVKVVEQTTAPPKVGVLNWVKLIPSPLIVPVARFVTLLLFMFNGPVIGV